MSTYSGRVLVLIRYATLMIGSGHNVRCQVRQRGPRLGPIAQLFPCLFLKMGEERQAIDKYPTL